MPFDGITIRALSKELNLDLHNARIDKIHQPEKDELVFSLRQLQTANSRLLISANARWARMHISSERKKNPPRPSGFCMLLRKYLEGGKIKEIKQIDFERIVHIRIEALDDFREWKDKLLICEFMGRHSNIILVNPENNIIIDAIKKYGSDLSSYREVLPGKEYVSPPQQGKLNPLNSSLDEFVALMWRQGENKTLVSSLFNVYSGISPFSAKEICTAAGIEAETPVEQCGEFEFLKIFNYIAVLLDKIKDGNTQAQVAYQNNQAVEFAPYLLATLPSCKAKNLLSINAACDRYYQDKLSLVRLESMQANLGRNIKILLDKAYKKKFFQEGDLIKAQENEKYKIWGEVLTAYAHQFRKGDLEAVLDDFYSGDKIIISLDPRFTPIQNAQKYFKIYNKSRKTLKHLENLMARNQEEIDYLESVMVAVKQAESPSEIEEIIEELENEGYIRERSRSSKAKKEKSNPRRFMSSDGLEILVGRNNRQNDLLTLKEADRRDLWLHSKDIPGTHVIVRLPKTISSIHDLPDSTLEEAASLAAYFSKAQQSDKVPVDYTFRANVRKPGGAKPGMVIYDHYWTVMARPNSETVNDLLKSENTDLIPG